MSKPRGGQRPSRSVDMSSRVLKEYEQVLRKREAWATDAALLERQKERERR